MYLEFMNNELEQPSWLPKGKTAPLPSHKGKLPSFSLDQHLRNYSQERIKLPESQAIHTGPSVQDSESPAVGEKDHFEYNMRWEVLNVPALRN